MSRKKSTKTGIAALIMCCLLAGCGEAKVQTEVETESSVLESELAETQTITETTDEEQINDADCPEGYVYDYQVSMEPIPEEIAALGGPCQGTIHAYPSRIAMALTELQMEEDPVLKAEVEKRIPEIEAALEEEIGGDFVVDGVILQDELSWVFICTEVATGYQFDLYYANKEYYALLNNQTSSENAISVNDYYKEQESVVFREDLLSLLNAIYGDCDFKILVQSGITVVDIVIAQYAEGEIDKVSEQEKILMLWEKLQTYDSTIYYNISLTFYDPEYRELIREKFDTTIRYEFGKTFNEEVVNCLAENEEVKGALKYLGLINKDDSQNLNTLLQLYKDEKYNEEVIWNYWIR